MKFEKLICAIAVIVALVFGNVPAVRAEGEFDGSSLYAASACLMDLSLIHIFTIPHR